MLKAWGVIFPTIEEILAFATFGYEFEAPNFFVRNPSLLLKYREVRQFRKTNGG